MTPLFIVTQNYSKLKKRILDKFGEIIRQFDPSSKKIDEVIHKIIALLESEILDLKRLAKKFPPEQVARFTF